MDALISSFQSVAIGESDRTAVKFLRAADWNVNKALQLLNQHKQDKISSFLKTAAIDHSLSSSNKTAIKFLKAADWDVEKALKLYANTDKEDDEKEEDDEDEDEETAAGFMRELHKMRAESTWKLMWEPEAEHSTLFRKRLLHRSTGAARASENFDLASLYKPPFDLMHQGTFDRGKDSAFEQNKWLIVNVQSKKEFSSYMLNRDTWGNEAAAEIIRNNFIFWQVYDHTDDGRRFCTDYEVDTFPIVMVIDPIKGKKMRSWTGMIHPDPLVEYLLELIDESPKAYQARQSVSSDDEQLRENDSEEEEDDLSPEKPVTIDAKNEGQEESSTEDDLLKAFFIFCLRGH